MDIGCGSGLSGGLHILILSDIYCIYKFYLVSIEDAGYTWIGLDISKDMLSIAGSRDDSDGDLFLSVIIHYLF